MAYPVFTPQGPQVDVQLFGQARRLGRNWGKIFQIQLPLLFKEEWRGISFSKIGRKSRLKSL